MIAGSRVLVIGQLWPGSTSEHRRKTLQELGFSTIGFDISPYTGHANRILSSVAHRLNIGPPVRHLNRDLLEFIAAAGQTFDYVWVDKGKWLYPETLLELRHITGAKIVHYTPDAQLVDNKSRQFKAGIPLYDVMFTTKPFEVELYRKLGARHIFLVHQSYDGSRLYPRKLDVSEQNAFGADVSFIGHCQPHYAACLKTARASGGRVRVWGPGWRRYSRMHKWAREIFSGDGVWEEDYAKALNGAAIGLCLLSKKIPETTTTRTFEIPGCGVFMLAERTEHHLALFREGVEAEFFGNHEELVEKIGYYLHNPQQREKIAAAGHERCLKSGYDNLSRMRQIVELIGQACG